MHGDADIVRRLWRAAWLRRLPLWVLGALPWLALRMLPGLLAWIAWCMWDAVRLRQKVAHGWASWLDAAVPDMEDSSALLVEADTPLAQMQRARLLARVDAALDGPGVRRVVRPHIGAGLAWLLPWLALAASVWFFGQKPAATAQAAAPRAAAAARAPIVPQLVVSATPPAYTGAARTVGAPRDLSLPEGGQVTWCLKNPEAVETTLELSDGRTLKVADKCAALTATESLFWRWRGARYTVKITPDAPPTITIAQPAQMIQELKTGAATAAMALSVQDDYRVQRATLHLTLARGSGENIKFTDREMPLPASNNPRLRNWAKTWTLAELGMEPGDELYFFVRAVDNAARPHTVQSPTYTLRLPAPEVEDEEETSAMPVLVKPQSLRSQRQIIIDTEQLIADMKSTRMSADTVRERSETIAGDQGQLRRRYGQFLGEESSLFGGDDHDEPAEKDGKMDVLHQFGHAHDEAENATLYDEGTKKILRRALTAMWEAEKALRAITPKTALAPELKALVAIKELQQADRIYLHKTAFVPPPIKEEIRMTGDVVGAASYARAQGESAEAIPVELRELVAALSNEGALPALWTRTAHDWVRERLKDDEQRLAAQRAVQDVLDGCLRCRPALRAWLRAGVGQAPVLLQAQPVTTTPFTRAWREGARN
jgi:hypothetical protein